MYSSSLQRLVMVSIRFGCHFSFFYMMFEAFGFTQERTLHCRKSSQLPSEGLLWQYSSAFLILTLLFLSS